MKVGIIGFGKIGKGLTKLCEKKRIEFVLYKRGDRLKNLTSCDLIIEAISEDFREKVLLYKTLVPHLKKEAVLSTTTSSLSIEKLAKAAGISKNFVGLHFFNPVHYIEFVEIIPSKTLLRKQLKKAIDFVRSLGYDYVMLPDSPGFVANWLLFNMLLAAVELRVKERIDEETIDRVVKKSLRHPMGPFELLDFIGIDTASRIFHNLFFEKKRLSVWKKYYAKLNR